MARLLITALERLGHTVELASRLRSRDGTGDSQRQRRIREVGRAMANRLIHRYRARPAAERPEAWFTYHLYYKAPDWIGPAVADALDIPYLVAEASHAPKRAGGPWDIGHRAVEMSLARADRVIGINSDDRACVTPLLSRNDIYVNLPPFLDPVSYDQIRRESRCCEQPVRLLAVGMMRAGDKMASYQILAKALHKLSEDRRWCLTIVGDGPLRHDIEMIFADLRDRVRFLGEKTELDLVSIYQNADILTWPAVNEAYGMALLEAQMAGLPVVAADRPGVADIVQNGLTGILVPEGDDHAFAQAIAQLLGSDNSRGTMGKAAWVRARDHHGLEQAGDSLNQILLDAREHRASGAPG